MSEIPLPGTNAYWFLEITPGRILLRRFARTFFLYRTLQRAIGRRPVIRSTFSFFGMRTKIVSFNLSGNEQSASQTLHSLKNIHSNQIPKVLKNVGLNPSRPALVSGCICFTAVVNFTKSICAVSFIFWSSFTTHSLLSITWCNPPLPS